MEPNYYPTDTMTRDRQIMRILNILILLAITISVGFIVLSVYGYGTVQIDTSNDVMVRINGHTVTDRTLKMRPGSYTLIISSPTIMPYQSTVQVSPFTTTHINPHLTQRSADAIASSVLGAIGSSGPPHPLLVRWFENNTWVVGSAVPGNTVMALHYDSSQKQWTVGYYVGDGYPQDISKLPTDVAAYVQFLESQHE